jgi:homopolymeric O-antigen transport system permease protein
MSAPRVLTTAPVYRVAPAHGWAPLRLAELWDYRDVFYFLTWRDIKVRYKQTLLGAAWAIIQPLASMVVFSVFFGRLAGMPSDGVPYPVFAYAALLPWSFFANGVLQGSQSLVNAGNLLTKVYFPRLAIPISAVLSGIVDFVPALGVLVVLAWLYGIPLTLRVLALPVFFLLALTAAIGVAVWLSAVNVEYRDVRHAVPFLTQMWLFATPVAYPSSLVREPWRAVYALNPMVGVVDGFRWCLLGAGTLHGPVLAVSAMSAVLIIATGAFYFRRLERRFADVV